MAQEVVADLARQRAALTEAAEAARALASRRAARFRKHTPERIAILDAADAAYAEASLEIRKLTPGAGEFRKLHPNFDRTGEL